MRTRSFILLLTILTPTVSTLGQGIVNFGNASSLSGWIDPNVDRRVVWSGHLGPPLAGLPVSSNTLFFNFTTLHAALYYAPATISNINEFLPASGGPATFKVSTSTTAGSWFGGIRTLDNIPPGTPANLAVIVWDSADYINPLPREGKDPWASSLIFSYTPPTSASPTDSELLMQNFVGFPYPSVPEPSSMF